jgi:branched-chain amino acid transport system permease protein
VKERPLFGSTLARVWPPLAIAVLLGAICLAASFGPGTLQRTVTDGLIKLLVVVGFYIFIGNSGVLSFGHTAFMAIGAYVSAWLTMPPMLKRLRLHDLPPFVATQQFPELPSALAAGAAAAGFAALVGIPLMRLRGISASIGTFAVLAVVISVLGNWQGLTGGKGSLIGVPLYTTMWQALAWAVIAVLVAYLYQTSRWGMRLRAAREDAVAARSLAVNIELSRLAAFVLSAFFVGIAGVLHAHFLGILSADAFYLGITFITLSMLVIGGMQSLSGAVAGVIVVTAILEILRIAEKGFALGSIVVPPRPGMAELVLAAVMLFVLLFRPDGIMGAREFAPPSFLRRTPKRPGAS